MERPRHCRCRSQLQPRESFPTARTFCNRPKARSRKMVRLYRANDEGARALINVPSCADAHDPLCRRLHAAPTPPAQSPRSARVTLHSCLIETYVRGTLNLSDWRNQADRMRNPLSCQCFCGELTRVIREPSRSLAFRRPPGDDQSSLFMKALAICAVKCMTGAAFRLSCPKSRRSL